ncbi:gp64 [Burkholderia phage phi1026b]|uniref:Gp64 n=3 Tax=root TaxID=1 RepID=Q6JIG7_9CAUD|nr:hypothetical protein [Burkholderia pseudomallei]NP_945095.1 gp64 [Burkholderia phage phi1026b]AAR23215.1 gp64 [Burkholderia phage phi1026b]UNI72058.1 hypothetical protein PhiBP821_18 [Burkholderia phage PhiBP82.1]
MAWVLLLSVYAAFHRRHTLWFKWVGLTPMAEFGFPHHEVATNGDTMSVITDRFEAVDKSGNKYNVVVRQDVIDTSTFAEQSSELSLKEYRLSNGEPLNRVSENVFRLVRSGVEITRI